MLTASSRERDIWKETSEPCLWVENAFPSEVDRRSWSCRFDRLILDEFPTPHVAIYGHFPSTSGGRVAC